MKKSCLFMLLLAATIACTEIPVPPDNPEPDPGTEIEPEPPVQVDYKLTDAKWQMNATAASAGEASWISSNKLFATAGQGTSKAYISTFSGGAATQPVRTKSGNNIVAANFVEGDGFEFVYPSISLSAGTTVDFMATFFAPSADAPKYWIFEYFENGGWKQVENTLRTATENPSIRYSFYVKYFSSSQYTSVHESFQLSDKFSGDLRMRCRVVGNYTNSGSTLSASSTAYIGLVNHAWRSCFIDIYEGAPVKDTKNILILGNSFTYYYSSNYIFKEIARSQGHEVNLNAFIKGGQYFSNHTALEMAQEEIKVGAYDYAILQDQSGQHARYFSDPEANASVLSDTKKLLEQIKAKSPAVKPMIENTWAFQGSASYEGYGSEEKFFEALNGGALLVTDATDTWMSPIAEAFRQAEAAGVTDLFHTDSKHPNLNGAYLKACVNYLMIYGEAFDSHVPDCQISASTAKKLRDIAENVVLAHIEAYRNPDSSNVTPGSGSLAPGGGEMDPDAVVLGENGIKTADQLLSFAYLFNRGEDISSYQNADGEVALLNDVDLGYAEWTPIGTSTGVSLAYNVIPSPSYPFKGIFNGGGHTIKGLKLNILDNQTNVKGLFGATSGATIKDLRIDGVKLTFTATGISDENISMGTIVGYALNTAISNVQVSNLDFSGKATSTKARNVCIGGIVGLICSSTSDYSSKVTDCSVNGSITNDIGTQYTNTNSVNIGGIVGMVPNKTGKLVLIKGCTNNATIDVKTHRAGGIIAYGYHSYIEDCVNNGNISADYSASKTSNTSITGVRIGGVMGICTVTTSNDYLLKNCTNNGNVVTTEAGSAAGGVAGLIRCFALTGCKNTGNVVAPVPSGTGPYRGLLIGAITSATNPSTVSGCSYKGSIGAAKDGSDAVKADASNYLSLGVTIASDASCPSWTATNVSFITD